MDENHPACQWTGRTDRDTNYLYLVSYGILCRCGDFFNDTLSIKFVIPILVFGSSTFGMFGILIVF